MAERNPVWAEVARRLSLTVAAKRLGYDLKVGLQKSPFRQDKKQSFSVYKSKDGVLAFKDHADDAVKGGLFAFVKLATGWDNKAIAKWLFEESGVDGSSSEFSKGKSAEVRRVVREAAFERNKEELTRVPVVAVPDRWSDEVAGFWALGADWIEKNAKRVAESRGWDVSVVHELAGLDKMSGPSLPWKNDHGVAFKVELPLRIGAGNLELVPVGYHQRFITFQGGERRKSFVYVPYVPAADKAQSPFQKALLSAGQRVPALPFVMGCLDNPKLIVILEGQWDAITFFHACGWLSDSVFPSVAVFGLRGADGIDPFLAFYSDWLRQVRPAVWLLGDNDKAGRKWAERRDEHKIHSKPSFFDRLKALGASRVVYRVVGEKYGKDFNDFYKAASPDAAFMARWMDKLGLGV